MDIQPSLQSTKEVFENVCQHTDHPTLLLIHASFPSDLLTPSTIFLKLSSGYNNAPSCLIHLIFAELLPDILSYLRALQEIPRLWVDLAILEPVCFTFFS